MNKFSTHLSYLLLTTGFSYTAAQEQAQQVTDLISSTNLRLAPPTLTAPDSNARLISANPGANNQPSFKYPQYPVAFDLHDSIFQRDYKVATDTMLKQATWGELGYFLWSVICYGVERKILRRATPNIEQYLLPEPESMADRITTGTNSERESKLTAAQIKANQQYADRVVRTISCFKPMAGAVELLAQIKAQGHPLLAFSNIGPRSYQLLAKQYPELMDKFDGRIIVEDQSTPAKPTPAAYQRCLEIAEQVTGTVPEKVIFYDDSPKKLAAAQNFRVTKTNPDGSSTTETTSRFVPVLCQAKSQAQIDTSRALLLAKLTEVRDTR